MHNLFALTLTLTLPSDSFLQEADPEADAEAGSEKFWIDVPTDCFGGVSPERKAADALSTLVTSVAVRTILAQEKAAEGESKIYSGLSEAIQTPMRSTETCGARQCRVLPATKSMMLFF